MRASVQNNPISRVRGPETTETSDRRDNLPLELQTKVRVYFTITEKPPCYSLFLVGMPTLRSGRPTGSFKNLMLITRLSFTPL